MDLNKAIKDAVYESVKKAFEGINETLSENIYLQSEALRNIEKYSSNSLLDERQVSELTGISLWTLRKWRCEKREIPYIRLGNVVRYKYSDILEYLKANTVKVYQDRRRTSF